MRFLGCAAKKQREVYQKVGHKRKSHESGLSHRESGLLYGVSSWTSSYALFWCRRTHSLASAYVSRQNLTGIRLILMQLQGSVVEFALVTIYDITLKQSYIFS